MFDRIENLFEEIKPDVDFCSLRYVREQSEELSVRQDVPEPVSTFEDSGVMLTVIHGSGLGYAATSDLTRNGLAAAAKRAVAFARATSGRSVVDFSQIEMVSSSGEYAGPEKIPWSSVSDGDKFDLLRKVSSSLKTDDRIVDWEAGLFNITTEMLYLTSNGGRIKQEFHFIVPSLRATANDHAETQTRTLGSVRGCSLQGGMEQLEKVGFETLAPTIADQALQLLTARNCPSGEMDVVLASDQMLLQIHESIGHPLEIDRILGDERNYAGTSFVTPDMFGSYQYGSKLLNVTFDPTIPQQFASYGYDDDGLQAEKLYIIQEGTLVRGLGGITSQQRSSIPGTANSRASSWNRPPIDRMANLNVEPGESTMEELIGSVENGIYMETNKSWSIDDSRNKFQFGCELGRLIIDGELTDLVKNPNYRGISSTFWRSLSGVGDKSTLRIYGTPYCGKGEPNQSIRVGHASPVCKFDNVDVFGGQE